MDCYLNLVNYEVISLLFQYSYVPSVKPPKFTTHTLTMCIYAI